MGSIRIIGIIVSFLLLTSAVVPEIKMYERKREQTVNDIFNTEYKIKKKKTDIELLKWEIIILLKEIEIQQS